MPGAPPFCTATIPRVAINITDPSYISEHMLDEVVKEKFHDDADDVAVRNQAIKFLQISSASTTRNQTCSSLPRKAPPSKSGPIA